MLKSLESSPLAKLIVPLLVFGLILGGWTWYNRYREGTATLPDDESGNGACTLWFVGSSSIRRWDSLHKDMAPWITHNRGINSATFDQILPRFTNIENGGRAPEAIILYAGENDIAQGAPLRKIIRQMAAFLEARSEKFGNLPVLVLSMKPSPGRWQSFGDQQILNGAIVRLLPRMSNAHYVDITTPLLVDGKLGDNYREDKVHMNPAGYRIWADVVRERLDEILPRKTIERCTGKPS